MLTSLIMKCAQLFTLILFYIFRRVTTLQNESFQQTKEQSESSYKIRT